MSASSLQGTWNYPTAVRFGAGRIAELPNACRELGIERPLIVTDRGLVDLPPVRATLDALSAGGLPTAVFAEVRGNPVGADVDAGVAAFRQGGHDGVVALGGGSALDVGKAVALMVGQDRPLWDFEDVADNWTRVDAGAMAPCVAVPTTSGTGSEVGRSSVIVRDQGGRDQGGERRKLIIFHPGMLPARVVADPALTVGLPANLTAWTGLDALSHCLEAYCSPLFHPQADGIAAEGIRLVFQALRTACAHPGDVDARARMMAASMMGATAFQKGLGAMHAVSHPVGARFDTHHGLTNAVMMPYVLQCNRGVVEDRVERLAGYLDLPGGYAAFFDAVLALRDDTGVATSLAALGVGEEHVAELAPRVVMDPTAGTNPVPIDEELALELVLRAVRGDLSAW